MSVGLALDRALSISENAMHKKQRGTVLNIRRCVESGSLLSKGLSENVHIAETTRSLIAHGESSGQLAQSLHTSRMLLEKGEELRSKCLSAMAYPIVIGIFALLLTLGLIRGVMPQIIPMLRSLQVDLPLVTRAVISVSDTLTDYGLHILAGIIALSVSLRFAYARSEKVKNMMQRLLISIPLIGGLVYGYHLSIFLRSCGALVESGSQVRDAYMKSASALSLRPLRIRLSEKAVLLAGGVPIAEILAQRRIPAYISPLLGAGEASGTLGVSMGRAAEILDRDIEHSMKRLTALIEPVMMAGMGTSIGAIALSIMMPIYEISKVLQR